MRTWSLTAEDPHSLRIAADARLGTPDYADDQIWELRLVGGEPAAVALETTYGLRARDMRLFPGFGWKGENLVNPEQFHRPPTIRRFFPNFIWLSMMPHPWLQVEAEYWAADSHSVGGRFRLTNVGGEAAELRLRLHAVLRPIGEGGVMSERTLSGASVLAGRTGSLAPVVFLSGGATVDQVAHPALVVETLLTVGEQRTLVWAHAALEDETESFDSARSLAARPWEAEVARLEHVNRTLVEVETGEPDWDAALAWTQRVVLGSFVGPTPRLPHASFIHARVPDRGFSAAGDGSDYNIQWAGQSTQMAHRVVKQVLPLAPELAKGILANFLAVQTPDGSIDWKPGLGGQRNGALSAPLLADMAWRIYQHTEDREFLAHSFDPLVAFFEAWFDEARDRDQDGVPEWDHTIQMGLDDCPTFVRWQSWGQGLDITLAETPDLAAILIREARALRQIAAAIGQATPESLESRETDLRAAIESSWSESEAIYRHRDRDAHTSPTGEVLGRGEGEFSFQVDRTFEEPIRVVVRSHGAEGLSHAVQVFIHGKGRRGRNRVERMNERDFRWFWEFGTATSAKPYASIERVEVRGLSEAFETEIAVADFTRQDLAGLLPLWAGAPDSARTRRLVRHTLLDTKRFLKLYGLASCSSRDPAYKPHESEGAGAVSMYWNVLLGEALVEHGYLDEAVELLGRLMAAAVASLRSDGAFRERYHPELPEGFGERDHIAGTAPLDLFLDVLGVRLISPRRLWIRGGNPFPWPVRLRWRGLELHWEEDTTQVTFPNGRRVRVDAGSPRFIELEQDPALESS